MQGDSQGDYEQPENDLIELTIVSVTRLHFSLPD